MRDRISNVPVSRVMQHLQKMTRFKGEPENMDDCLTRIDELSWIETPFRFIDLRVVLCSMSVVGGIVAATNREPLVQFLTETPDRVCLLVDQHLEGARSIFVGMCTCETDMPRRWLAKMTTPQIYVNSRAPDLFMATPLRAFLP